MSKTIGNYTWSDTIGLTAAKDGTNIGLRCYLYLSAAQGYGSCYAFFNISYIPLPNSKLRVKIDSIQLRQDTWKTKNWQVFGSVKVNNLTLFDGTLSTPSGVEYNKNTNITVGNSYYVDIDYPNSQGSLELNYDFSLHFVTYIYSTAWKGWTNTEEDTCSVDYGYSHTHTYADATCTEPKTCTGCGLTSGAALGHSYSNNVCTRCGLSQYIQKKYNVYINNGSKFAKYNPHIDNGSALNRYFIIIEVQKS